jgi:uncharacterized membrane protein
VNPQKYKALLLCVTAVLALLVASPALQRLLVYPQTEFFTEMWLLSSEHTAENFPFNITVNENYSVFLGISNHLGRCAYYVVQVKFRTQNQSAPDPFAHTPSSLPPLYSINLVLADKGSLELPVTFSFNYSYDEDNLQVNFNQMMFNDVALDLTGHSTALDGRTGRFFGSLIFELWIYSDAVGGFTYHQRYNDLKLNMTV